jgi:hypothetical protein
MRTIRIINIKRVIKSIIIRIIVILPMNQKRIQSKKNIMSMGQDANTIMDITMRLISITISMVQDAITITIMIIMLLIQM